MLLTVSTTHRPATDLGFLLHKHPDRAQAFDVPFGMAHVFYPQADEDRCTAALLLDIDAVGLVRRGPDAGRALTDYVNDRPYVASSFLCVAMQRVFASAMAGTCKGHEELAATPIALEAALPAVAVGGDTDLPQRLFGPLGYAVEAGPIPLDPAQPDWGDSRYVDLTIRGVVRLADLLTHLYVLLPVLDAEKHYWVGDDEIEKLRRRGEGWLPGHPERELIVRRYLKGQRALYAPLLEELAAETPSPERVDEDGLEAPIALREHRHRAVLDAVAASGAGSVVDLGCGPGALLEGLLALRLARVVGTDVSPRALEIAARRLHLDELHAAQRSRIELFQSSLTYRDPRIEGFDAAILMEVIEHLDRPRLEVATRHLFGAARPGTVIVTTPNAEYNVRWERLPAGAFRHSDHRFEWTRAEFAAWGDAVASEHGYAVRYEPVGDVDPEVGPPTQMAVFTR